MQEAIPATTGSVFIGIIGPVFIGIIVRAMAEVRRGTQRRTVIHTEDANPQQP